MPYRLRTCPTKKLLFASPEGAGAWGPRCRSKHRTGALLQNQNQKTPRTIANTGLPAFPVLPGRRRYASLLTVFALLGILAGPLTGLLQAQEENDLARRLRELERSPVLRQLLEDREALNEDQRRMLGAAVDNLSDEEVDQELTRMGLSTEGSPIARRVRLKIELGAIDPPELPVAGELPRIEIENASEGEFLRGEEGEGGLLRLEGRIRVRLPGGVFYADRVLVDTERQEVYGEGNVVYRERESEITAERIIYNRKLGTGILYNAEGYREPIYFIGRSIQQVSEDHFSISHAYFTTSVAKPPHYNFTARRLWVYDDNKLFAAGVLYYVGGVPVLPLPFLFASDWGTGLITQVGHSDVQGWFVETTYQFGVPEAAFSSWQPMAYRFKFDWHQTTGEMAGVEFFRFSPNLNYYFDLGGARFKRYEIIGDFRERDELRFTNQVRRSDGTIGRVEDRWYKAFAIVNYRAQNLSNNNTRNVQLRFEDYSHFLYEYEFGGRYVPESTIPALYANSEAGRGLVRPNTNWNLVYTENIDDLAIRVEATRNNTWDTGSSLYDDSEYLPANDVLPSIDLTKKWNMGRIPYLDLPVYWYHNLHTDLEKQYSVGKEFQSINNNLYQTALRTYFGIFPYVSLSPSVGYGAQKSVPESRTTSAVDAAALAREARKNSYQFVFSETSLTLGPHFLFLEATYRVKNSFKEEQNDAPVINLTGFTGNQKVREVELTLQTSPIVNTMFSINTVYDFREFDRPVESRERWFYPVFRTDIYFDFINGFRPDRENLLSRNRVHFMGLRITNDYVYDPRLKRDHSDVVGLNFEAGGFDLWFLRRLRYLERGAYWYHVYYNPELDHLRYTMKADVQLWSWGYLEMELESRATDVERYRGNSTDENGEPDHVTFGEDVANGLGFNGGERRQDAVFNVAFFRGALILDLEDWEYRFGYELEQRAVFGGTNTLEVVNYYDNRVFFSMTLLRFDFGGIGDRGSRFIINRQRVRPGDIGRTSIGSERLF